MRLRDLARFAELGKDVLLAEQSPRSREQLLRKGLPLACDLLFGRGAGTLAGAGLELLERRGMLQPEAIEGDYTVIDDGGCQQCGQRYRPAGERRLAAHLDSLDSGIVYVLGRRGTGKTALSFRLAERWQRETFVLGVPQRKLPEGWREIRSAADLEHLPLRCTVIADDAGIVLDSQDSGSGLNRAMKHLVMIVRHLDVKLVVNTQYAAAVNKYVLDADALFVKALPRMWQVIERDELHRLFGELEAFWQGIGARAEKEHAWAISDVYTGPVHYQPPSFWSDAASKNKGA